MASYPPPPPPPPGYDPRDQRRFQRDQFRAQMRAQRDAIRAQRDQVRFQMRSLRRSSALGPILLIAVGVLFLLIESGRLDREMFWGWYSHWWPVLLVAAGVLLLAEWAFDQYHLRDGQRPPYRRTLGSGVFLFLLIVGLAGYFGNHVHDFPDGHSKLFPGWHIDPESFDQFFGDKHESDETMDLSFAAGDSLSIANPRGDVTVNGTSDDNQMHLAIHKQIYAHSDTDADTKSKQFNPDNKYRNSAWTVTMPSLEGASADLVISVPASTQVSITSDHGDIHIASVKAAVFATANHGDIELSAITGMATAHINNPGSSLSARSMGGGIAIEGHAQDVTLSDIAGPVTLSGEYFGTHLERINGAVHYHSSRTDLQVVRLDGETQIGPDSDLTVEQAVGPLVMNTRDHNIKLDRIAGDVSVSNRNGTIELTAAPPLGAIRLENKNGSVTLVVPEHTGFSAQANTTNGEIDTGFPLALEGRKDSKSLSGMVGAGGPLVSITTTNGDISLHSGAVVPLSPNPPVAPKLTLLPVVPPHSARAGIGIGKAKATAGP